MKIKRIFLLVLLSFCSLAVFAQKAKDYQLKSPNGAITLHIESGAKLQWSVQHRGQQIIAPSVISMTLQTGEVLGDNAKVTAKTENVNSEIIPINYVKSVIPDIYNQITLNCKGDYGVIFRVYDDAVAYRFFTEMSGDIIITNEEANFNFTEDYESIYGMQTNYRGGKLFNSSFENLYKETKLSQFPQGDSLAFLPILVDAGSNKKAELFEVDLEDYPGMNIQLNESGKGFKGVFPPYPLEFEVVSNIDLIPTKRADFIAKTKGTRNFPWRAVVISEKDIDLLDASIVQKLASPSRIDDTSWINVGQVAWDWWSGINISKVDFKAGMNSDTYKYFIDFAEKYHIPYVMIDAGWNEKGDLTKPKAAMELEEVVSYGFQKGVGIMVWSSWKDICEQMDVAMSYFEKIGIKGMKIDYIDRDDQLAIASTYEIAKVAAKHHLLVDYHGVSKPTGLQRTYPNVVGYEVVYGLEQYKFKPYFDGPRYAVTIPFIRNQAGPMDYTSGAMRNSTKKNYQPNRGTKPMALGTRVNQMAQYVVFEVPIQMLSDSPSLYMQEQECTEFITNVPTTFDETIPLDGQVGEFVSIARRKGTDWFVGAMTNWTPRELEIDFSFLGDGEYQAEIFKDGINADRDATDYKTEVITVKASDKISVQLMDGGGWVAKISQIEN